MELTTADRDKRQCILVVEDEPLIAILIEDVLIEAGYDVAGPVSRVDAAIKLLETRTVNAAILDVNLGDHDTYPVAETLRTKAIPFLFSTGYSELGIREDFAGTQTIRKPFNEADLLRHVTGLMSLNPVKV